MKPDYLYFLIILSFLWLHSKAESFRSARSHRGNNQRNLASEPNDNKGKDNSGKNEKKEDFPMPDIEEDTFKEHIYSYDDATYFSEIPDSFSYVLPSCYYPTPTSYQYDLKYCYGHQTRNNPPPCITENDLVFDNKTGAFYADQTFYNCMENIPDVASMPTFFNGKYHGCLLLETQITLLNLVRVDEVDGLVELQIIVDYSWYDNRYNMPDFWKHVPSSFSGFDITTMLINESVVLWKPTIVFPDAQTTNVMSETLTLSRYDANVNATVFFYEVTYDLILVQPGFNFRRYPNDEQNIIIRYSALNYDAQQLQLFPHDIACSYLPDKTCSFASNPIWIWRNEPSFSACTAYPDQKASLIYPAYVYYSIKIVRQGDGIVVRLVLPLMFLLLISVLTFWVAYDNRVDTTITLLLSVSALYIIILQSIPLVGYLTDIDKYVFWMFLLLCIVVSLHQMYATLIEKVETWPLRQIYLRIIEMIGRCFVPLAIVVYFFETVAFGSKAFQEFLIIVLALSIFILFVRECIGVRSAFYNSMGKLVNKANQPMITAKELSWIEVVALNRYYFNTWSLSLELIGMELHQKGELHFEKPTSVTLRNMTSMSNIMGNKSSNKNMGKGNIEKLNTSDFLHRLHKTNILDPLQHEDVASSGATNTFAQQVPISNSNVHSNNQSSVEMRPMSQNMQNGMTNNPLHSAKKSKKLQYRVDSDDEEDR